MTVEGRTILAPSRLEQGAQQHQRAASAQRQDAELDELDHGRVCRHSRDAVQRDACRLQAGRRGLRAKESSGGIAAAKQAGVKGEGDKGPRKLGTQADANHWQN